VQLEVKDGERAEYRERDDLLDDLQLRGGVDGVAPAVGGHLQQVFKEGDAPARHDDEQEWLLFVSQMPVPRERHKHVREGQQDNRQPAGINELVHNFIIRKTFWVNPFRHNGHAGR